jgi:uncharacterized protein (UPF0276 family)
MSWSRLDLGVGLVAAAGADLLWPGIADLADVVEIEPQTMWRPLPGGGWQLSEAAYEWAAGLGRPALVHGVAFPVGGCQPPDPAGVALTAESARRVRAAHWSEHLSFNRAAPGPGGEVIDAGFFLPPAQSPDGVARAAGHVAAYQAASGLPFLIETGVSYLQPRPGELSDGAFVAGVAAAADCGILLDLHNLLANERNGRQPVDGVLAELPLDRVLEVHLAGGFEARGFWLDAHHGPPDDELLALAARVLPRLPNLRALIWEAVPESLAALGAGGVRAILTRLHRLWDSAVAGRGRGRATVITGSGRPGRPGQRITGVAAPVCAAGRAGLGAGAGAGASGGDAAGEADLAWENGLAAYTSRFSDQPPSGDPGLGLLRWLSDQARLSQLALARPDLLRPLLAAAGPDATERLLLGYFRARPARLWPAQEGAQFAAWLAGRPGQSAGCC